MFSTYFLYVRRHLGFLEPGNGRLGRKDHNTTRAKLVDVTFYESMKFPCGSWNLIRCSGQFFRQIFKSRVTSFYTASVNDPDMAAASTEHHDFPKEEEKILELWKKLDAFRSSLEQSKDRPRYAFVEYSLCIHLFKVNVQATEFYWYFLTQNIK